MEALCRPIAWPAERPEGAHSKRNRRDAKKRLFADRERDAEKNRAGQAEGFSWEASRERKACPAF